MKLWNANVQLNIEVVVAAENEADAKYELDIDDVIADFSHEIEVYWSEIKSMEALPYGWKATEPYGHENGTCEAMMVEIIEELQREKDRAEQDKLQLKLDLDME